MNNPDAASASTRRGLTLALAAAGVSGLAVFVNAYGVRAVPDATVYTTAKNLAQQARHSAVVALLSKSLAEEESADQLLNQIARSI